MWFDGGMLRERFIDATAAFILLVSLSQKTNTRVGQIARMLIEKEDLEPSN